MGGAVLVYRALLDPPVRFRWSAQRAVRPRYNMLGDALRDVLDPRLRGSRAGGARGRSAARR